MKRTAAIFTLLMMLLVRAWGQNGASGTDFWVAFLPLEDLTTLQSCKLYANPSQNGSLTVSNPRTGWSQTVTLSADVQLAFSIPSSQVHFNPNVSSYGDRGLHVTSTVPIELYALCSRNTPCVIDGTLVQ